MTDTLLLPRFSLNNASSKEKIIHLLAESTPITTKQVAEKLKTDYSVDISYQGVHKILQELESENTIEKTGSNWKLRKEWLEKGQEFFGKALEKQNGQKNRYNIKPDYEGTQTFEFDSFTEFCTRTADIFANKRLQQNNNEYIVCVSEYGFWPIKFNFDHFELLYSMVKNFPKSKYIMQNDTSFGRWILEQYKKVGVTCAPIGTKVAVDEDILIQGSYIFQIKFSEDGKKTIAQYWNKWKSINDTMKDFGLVPDPKINVTVQLTKNPAMAKLLRNELEKYFEVKK